jgi:hypothetical protein
VTGVCVGQGREGVGRTACRAMEGQRERDSVTGHLSV